MEEKEALAAFDEAILALKPISARPVKALLSMEGISLEGGECTGLNEQLEAIKTDYPFLFEEEKPQLSFGRATPGALLGDGDYEGKEKANRAIRSLFNA
ncbi:MAG: phage scaffolding protein [Oscillospiraceae bacterium]|jgi:hypothetical protein|nr:phage scaffolding protein [Oscillospiraceae bacterium]